MYTYLNFSELERDVEEGATSVIVPVGSSLLSSNFSEFERAVEEGVMLLVVADWEIVFPHELELHDATTLSVEGTAGMTTLSGDGLVTLFVVREGSKLSLWDHFRLFE